MKSFKERCIELRKQDKSISEIMEITGRPKTSVYQHIKDLPLSALRVQKYRARAARHIRKFAIARKGKSNRLFAYFDTWTPGRVLLVAHLMFDGEIMRKRCVYHNRSIALISRVEALMGDLYEYAPARYQDSVTGVRSIGYHNVELSAYLHTKAQELLRVIGTISIDMKREFVRAFFDDEGYIDFLPARNRRRIRGYQKNMRILKLIRQLLDDLGVQSRVVLPNEVQIVGKGNLERFEQEINFSPGIYMNGNRSNSRWKIDVEKRELLKQAITSFKN